MTKHPTPGAEPTFYANVAYKLWVRSQLSKRKISLASLVKRIKRHNSNAKATTAGLSQFLGPANKDPVPSNTTLMPWINKALGAAPPPECDPGNRLAQVYDLMAARWPKMSTAERRAIIALVGGDPSSDDSDETD